LKIFMPKFNGAGLEYMASDKFGIKIMENIT
jgi:hypothetical protein